MKSMLPTSGIGDRPHAAGHALSLSVRLREALVRERIAWCHWKSNDAQGRAVRGDSDLDLLVGLADVPRFVEVIRGLGFKDAVAPTMKRVPGVFHSYALDEPSGRLLHIHVHEQLVLGDDTTKNYRLPIEDAYLRSVVPDDAYPLPIPAPELELVVFVVRMMLKHCTWDAIASGKGRLAASETRELEDLLRRADLEGTRAVVREHLPFVGGQLWERCSTCVQGGASRADRVRTAHRLERALAPYARRRPGADGVLRLLRRARVIVRRHVLHRPPPRARLAGGGRLIAVVGGDGSGKSTVVAALRDWLSKDLTTTTAHLGKPTSSLTSTIVRRVWKRGVRGLMRESRVSGAALAASDGRAISPRMSARLIQQVTVARDRHLAYRRARRLASAGGIVISDRFPLPEIELMDGPLAGRMLDTPGGSGIARFLARRERTYYERIHDPDLLVVLTVDPDLAVERRRGIDDPDVVRRRCEEIRDRDWSRLDPVVVDAGRSKDEVLAEIKSAIWSRI
jgi:thymidylate kinase